MTTNARRSPRVERGLAVAAVVASALAVVAGSPTRVARGMFDAAAEASFVELFRANVARCTDGFVDACSQLLASDPTTIDPAVCGEIDYLNLMVVALGKWLASLVQAHGAHKVELASTHGYRVDPSAPCEDLVSIAMRFTPIIAAPPDPLAPQRSPHRRRLRTIRRR